MTAAPQPTEGGSYILEDGQLRCVERTIQPGEPLPPADSDPTPDED